MLKPRFGFGENGEIVDNGKPDYSNVEDIKPVVRDKEWSRFKKNMEKIKNKHKPQSTAERMGKKPSKLKI